jgi:hypothetical protein
LTIGFSNGCWVLIYLLPFSNHLDASQLILMIHGSVFVDSISRYFNSWWDFCNFPKCLYFIINSKWWLLLKLRK